MMPKGPRSSERGEGGEPTDSWWATLAQRLLHRIQVEVIEVLQQSKRPMSARDLSGAIEGAEPAYLAQHHLPRLRKIGAVEYAGGAASPNPVDIPYRLVRELSDDGR